MLLALSLATTTMVLFAGLFACAFAASYELKGAAARALKACTRRVGALEPLLPGFLELGLGTLEGRGVSTDVELYQCVFLVALVAASMGAAHVLHGALGRRMAWEVLLPSVLAGVACYLAFHAAHLQLVLDRI